MTTALQALHPRATNAESVFLPPRHRNLSTYIIQEELIGPRKRTHNSGPSFKSGATWFAKR
ncbi:hypothetical protein ABIG04_009960 [Bradyrhizobium japonicum]